MAHESWVTLLVVFIIHFFVGRIVQGLIKVEWPFIAPTLAVLCIGMYYWPFHLFSLPFSLAAALGVGIGVYVRQMAED